jgi:NADH-ubiquinone oxidoreductase chain 2
MLVTSLTLLLLSNAVSSRRDKSILFSRTTLLILFYCFILLIFDLNLIFVDKGLSLFGGLIYCKSHSQIFALFIIFLSLVILILTSFYPRKIFIERYSSLYHIIYSKYIYSNAKILNKNGEQFKLTEYPLIILFIVLGAIFLMSSNDLITIFLSIELQSYGLYIISTIYRNSELSTNAGLTYFLLGGLASCIILLGQSLLYINTGNTSLDSLYLINNIFDNIVFEELFNYNSLYLLSNTPSVYLYTIQTSLLIMSVGFLFKMSAAPFHFWSPDVYDAIPTIVTTFVAIIAKVSILIMFLELVYYTGNSFLSVTWINNLILSSLLSLIIGSILGLTQFRIKRLYAYSTISHIGFLLLALSVNSVESVQAFLFYLIQYSISNLNAFILLITIGYSFFHLVYKESSFVKEEGYLKDVNNSPIQLVSQLKGYFKVNPMLSVSLAITLFSFIGVPPLIGFFGKQMILSAALDNGYVFITLVAILTSVISAVYYLIVVKNIFFEENDQKINPNFNNLNALMYIGDEKKKVIIHFNYRNIVISSSLTNAISIFTLIILLFILVPKEWLNITNILSSIIFYY